MQGSVNDNKRLKVYGESDDNSPTGMYSLKIAHPECDPHFVCMRVCVCVRMAHCVMGGQPSDCVYNAYFWNRRRSRRMLPPLK